MIYKNPYIKVTWQDTHENFTPEKISRIKSYFQKKYNTKHIQIITKVATNDEDTKLASLDISESISDYQYQKMLMRDFIKENNITIDIDLIDRLDNRVNEQLTKQIEHNTRHIEQLTSNASQLTNQVEQLMGMVSQLIQNEYDKIGDK